MISCLCTEEPTFQPVDYWCNSIEIIQDRNSQKAKVNIEIASVSLLV